MVDRKFHTFVVKGGPDGYLTTVSLDGIELKGVTRLQFESEPQYPNRLTLDFIPRVVIVEAEGSVTVNGEER